MKNTKRNFLNSLPITYNEVLNVNTVESILGTTYVATVRLYQSSVNICINLLNCISSGLEGFASYNDINWKGAFQPWQIMVFYYGGIARISEQINFLCYFF